jgi:hypothetical protein
MDDHPLLNRREMLVEAKCSAEPFDCGGGITIAKNGDEPRIF